MADDFNDDADVLKQMMTDRNRRLKIASVIIAVGGGGTLVAPIVQI